MRRPAARTTTVLAGALLLLATGCSADGGDGGEDLQTITAATAAVSPAVSNQPAGAVVPVGQPVGAAAFDAETGTVVLLTDDATHLLLYPAGDVAAPPRDVPLPGGVAALSAPHAGTVVVPAGRSVVRVNLANGETSTVDVDGEVRSATLLDDGGMVVGTEDGTVLELDADGAQTAKVTGFASVDALGVTGDQVTALDREQTSVSNVLLDKGQIGMALRAGEGATNLATDHFGRILVTDTTGGELIALTTDPLMMRQRYPVPNSPYAVTVDESTNLVWVTVTGTNEVIGYDLASGIPIEKHRYPTVRQPNAVAVDSKTGTLFVASGTGDGLQRIETAGQ
ncbi:YncE family protein [Rhodococcus kronopolitis]|uniref:YncE family protein n=1 Tax=Rhodococcus kronopolitis TaxID=1460226 RepID=A0ABV9FU85_9NOCA